MIDAARSRVRIMIGKTQEKTISLNSSLCLFMSSKQAERILPKSRYQRMDVSIANESNQVAKGHLVDALAHTGDEGRDTLR